MSSVEARLHLQTEDVLREHGQASREAEEAEAEPQGTGKDGRACLRVSKGRGVAQERRERHRQNYMHITIHTSQTWADTFISELNDTHVEAELRTKHIPPQVPPGRAKSWTLPTPVTWRSRFTTTCFCARTMMWTWLGVPAALTSRLSAWQLDVGEVVRSFRGTRRRLLVLGYNATLTTAVEAPRQPKRHFDQIKVRTGLPKCAESASIGGRSRRPGAFAGLERAACARACLDRRRTSLPDLAGPTRSAVHRKA